MKEFKDAEGATPLDPDEAAGLLPDHIATQRELNEWEQKNILEGRAWAVRKKPAVTTLLTERFVRELHKRMLGETWKWAGTFRKTGKNIGIEAHQIGPRLNQELANLAWRIEHAGEVSEDEASQLAVELHHKLVSIHPFPNGNGRHSRLMADLLLIALSYPPLPWGSSPLVSADQTRGDYLAALRDADNGDLRPLLAFARRK